MTDKSWLEQLWYFLGNVLNRKMPVLGEFVFSKYGQSAFRQAFLAHLPLYKLSLAQAYGLTIREMTP